jgi:hypothetical protein
VTPHARGEIRASSVIEIRSGDPLQGTARDPDGGFAKDVPLGRTQVGTERSRAGVCGRGVWTRRPKGWRGGEAEASRGKYSRFQGNRVMTQFRKDR